MSRRVVPLGRVGDLLFSARGLGTADVQSRRRQFGANDIAESIREPWRDIAADTAKDPMLWFLLAASVLHAFLGEYVETGVLLASLVPLLGMDVFLHQRTRASTQALRSRLAERATVIRDGEETHVAALELVPGDLVVVSASHPFPADGIITSATGLQVDESALTGESFPVRKRELSGLPYGPDPAVDLAHWGFAGTRALTGRALVRVAYTGGETQYGEIVRAAAGEGPGRSPLQTAIADLVQTLVIAATAVCVVLGLVRVYQGFGWGDALLTAVTLAAAALPEEFPVTLTFFLGLGVYRLARRRALVRRSVTVENIGRVSCICSDKTGTITEGLLSVSHLVTTPGLDGDKLLGFAAIASRRDSNDPVDLAILREADQRGAILQPPDTLRTFPFTEDARRETCVVRDEGGEVFAVSKGSPEVILSMSGLAENVQRGWASRVARLAEGGHKVLACAWRPLASDEWQGNEPTQGYRFAGILALEDRVRPGVVESVESCRRAGIHVIMVTGDHPLTARAIARDVGLGNGNPVVVAADDVEVGQSLRAIDVIARATPAQKLALVRALQAANEIVAVTGDGVNDVPALQAADVGIAMGEHGTPSAREAAAIVLLDDNFRTIVSAVQEGRALFRNLQLAFAYLLMLHAPLVLSALLVPLWGNPLLYLPIHIVWLELILHPTALLVFHDLPPSAGRLNPQTGNRPGFFTRMEWLLIAAVGVMVSVWVLLGYARSLGLGGTPEHARAMAMAMMTFASAAIAAGLSRLRSWPSRLVVAATLLTSIVLIQVPALSTTLKLEPLHAHDWARAVVAFLFTTLLPLLFGLGSQPVATAPVETESE